MALIAWYPLTSDLKDYSGFNNDLIAYSSFSYDSNGKIGGCYKSSSTSSYSSSKNNIYLNNDLSFCIWVKLDAYSTSPTAILTNHDYTNTSNFGINLSGDKIGISIGYSDGTREWNSRNSKTTIQLNKWYHIAMTYKKNSKLLRVYVNGEKEYEGILSKETKASSKPLQLNKWSVDYNGYSTTGRYNDVRIYDHALSTKEIKELSRAKILHYKFDDTYEEPTINLQKGFDLTTAEKGSDYFIKKDTDQWYQGVILKNTNVTAGKTYTWSLDIKSDKVFSFDFDTNCTASNYTGNDAAMTNIIKLDKNYDIPGEWKRVSVTVTVRSDAQNPYLHHSLYSSSITGEKVYVRRFQLEEKDYRTPYIDGTRKGEVKDCSGLKNNGTIELSSSPTWLKDSILGSNCISKINGSDKYLKIDGNVKSSEEISISFWLKINDNSDASWTSLFGGIRDGAYNSKHGISIHIRPENKIFTKFYGSNSKVDMNSTVLDLNNWNHVVITNKNNLHCIYVNGIKTSDTTDIGNIDWTSVTTLYLGRAMDNHKSRNVSIDDFRIYATCLNDDDINVLYKTKASVDNNGKLFVNNIIENSCTNNLIQAKDISVGNLTTSDMSITNADSFGRRIIKNSASTNGTFRIYFPLNILSQFNGKNLCFSFNYRFLQGNSFTFTDWCDLSIQKYQNNGIIRAHSSRSSYDNTYRFMDCSIGANTEIEIWNIQLKLGTINDYKSSINQKGQLITEEILELDFSNMITKEFDGAKWVRLFYHNNKAGTVLFSSDKKEFLKCSTEDKISDLWALEMFRDAEGKFELLLQYQSGGNSFNRWKQSSNFTKEAIKGYEAVKISWSTNGWGGLEYNNSGDSWADGTVNHSNWYYAIGTKNAWSGGIPAWNAAETGYVELWVRCEDYSLFKLIKNGNSKAFEFIEI